MSKFPDPKSFGIIESVGVIHHLKSPITGLKSLCSVLKPGGFMKLGFYSKIGREFFGILEAQSFVKEHNYPSSYEGILEFRHFLATLPEHSKMRRLEKLAEYSSISGMRDMVFHVQETCYTWLEIKQLLDNTGLEFVGVELPEEGVGAHITPTRPSKLRAEYQQRFPSDINMTSLESWHRFESEYHPGAFKSMYQFWVRRPM